MTAQIVLTYFAVLQLLTVPYLIDNPEVGYVQTRWIFANPDESYLTKVCVHVQLRGVCWEFMLQASTYKSELSSIGSNSTSLHGLTATYVSARYCEPLKRTLVNAVQVFSCGQV